MKDQKSSVSSKLKETLKGVTNPHKARPPLWAGPESDTENGGITFSMLSRFIVCRERFRVQYLEGWRPADAFNHQLEFGNMWHVCEEALSEGMDWNPSLNGLVRKLLHNYPFDRDQINHWYGVCRTMFPIYVEYWAATEFDKKSRTVTPLLQEQVFNVPYTLPSGRTVRLRGKWDEVVLVDDKSNKLNSGIWVGDHKTKSRIKGLSISRQLTNDLQMCMYLVALLTPGKGESGAGRNVKGWRYGAEVRGVRYNVVKRPGQYQGEKETAADFQRRLEGIVREKSEDFFARWETPFSSENIAQFRKMTLDPLLENAADDYQWWSYCNALNVDVFNAEQRHHEFPHHYPRHFVMPFGVYNPLLEGGATDLDLYITEGSTVGLERSETLFEELK